jgi:hypothetical protein
MTTKECECGAPMSWGTRGLVFKRWRLECLCGRAGPWRRNPDYEKLGPPPMSSPYSALMITPPPRLPPFQRAERELWGQRWTAEEAEELVRLIRWGEAAAGGPVEATPDDEATR